MKKPVSVINPLHPFVTWLCSIERWTSNSVGSGSTGRWYTWSPESPPIISCFISFSYFLHPVDVDFQKILPNNSIPPQPPLKEKKFYCNSNVLMSSVFLLDSQFLFIPKDFIFKFSLRNSFLVEMCMYWYLWNLIFRKDKNSCHLLQLIAVLLFFSYIYLYLWLSN